MHTARDILTLADRVLRALPITARHDGRGRLRRLILLVVMYGMAYGAVMGTFGGIDPSRFLQMAYSAVKVPVLLFTTFALSLPFFFVVNTLMGLRDDFGDSIRALASAQAGLTIVLASVAPITAFWYISVPDYSTAVLYNTFVFALASFAAQIILRRHYAPLIRRNPAHRSLMWAWLVIYAFVGIQMGWVMRPFIGKPGMAIQFFREEAWTNAYIAVFELVVRVFSG